MMTNLFESFDPATSMSMSFNWMSLLFAMIVIPPTFWMIPSRLNMMIMVLYMKLNEEFKTNCGATGNKMIMIYISLFMFILWNNIMGMVPYSFTTSSQTVFTTSMAFPFWSAIIMFGWMNFTQKMFAHLVPENAPTALLPFLVCVETVSTLIRPGALAIRLTANMIAGHIIMHLVGNMIESISLTSFPLIMTMEMLIFSFETAVALVQAYVFVVLLTLYNSELN